MLHVTNCEWRLSQNEKSTSLPHNHSYVFCLALPWWQMYLKVKRSVVCSRQQSADVYERNIYGHMSQKLRAMNKEDTFISLTAVISHHLITTSSSMQLWKLKQCWLRWMHSNIWAKTSGQTRGGEFHFMATWNIWPALRTTLRFLSPVPVPLWQNFRCTVILILHPQKGYNTYFYHLFKYLVPCTCNIPAASILVQYCTGYFCLKSTTLIPYFLLVAFSLIYPNRRGIVRLLMSVTNKSRVMTGWKSVTTDRIVWFTDWNIQKTTETSFRIKSVFSSSETKFLKLSTDSDRLRKFLTCISSRWDPRNLLLHLLIN